jgi:DNA-binding IscR family transcriptional regulator
VRTVDCSLRALWGAVDAAVQQVLDRVTLAQLTSGERRAGAWLAERLEFDVRPTQLRRN